MTAARVTVLMPVHNAGRYLREAVESILGQTFTDFEFLIIDDGSTDDSVEIVRSYHDPRIRLVRNDRNLGLTVSLNKGLGLIESPYVARMDADDISRPERLARQVRFMDANPGVGVCGSWVRFFSESNHDVWKLPASSEEIRCRQFHTVGVAHPSVLLRRELFAEHGLLYDPKCRYSQDFELWGRAIRLMDFANIQQVLLDYRMSPRQIGVTHGAEQLATAAPLRLQRVRELGLEPTPEQQKLHEMILNEALPPEPAYLERAEQWLLQLEAANRRAGTYPAGHFSRRLLDIWFSTCLVLADASPRPLRSYLRSPLWSAARAPLWHRARALAAWAVRRGIWQTVRGPRRR